jgi:hypothetical protein
MAVPTVVGVGTVASGTTTMTPPFPASIASNDILLTVCESVGGQNITLPGGWAQVSTDGTPVSPVVQSTNTQLTVIWRRYDGTGSAPALSGTTDHCLGRMIAIRGCPTVGNPWNIVSVAVEATSDTSASWPGVTTTSVDCLVLEILATSADIATAQISALTNASYTSITERMDNAIATGNGGVVICYSGVKTSAGPTGASTATLTTAGFKAFMTLAMAPVPPGLAEAPGLLQRSSRPSEMANVAGPYAPVTQSQILIGG